MKNLLRGGSWDSWGLRAEKHSIGCLGAGGEGGTEEGSLVGEVSHPEALPEPFDCVRFQLGNFPAHLLHGRMYTFVCYVAEAEREAKFKEAPPCERYSVLAATSSSMGSTTTGVLLML